MLIDEFSSFENKYLFEKNMMIFLTGSIPVMQFLVT